MTKHYETILRAYTLLEDVTPLRYDCGKLCGSLCCENNGNDGETLGMWLLPFEKDILSAVENANDNTAYTFNKASDGTETVFCNGECTRFFRPFACRIYPFYAHVAKKSDGRTKITIKPDPRARLSCPIVMRTSYLRPTIEFVTCAKAAVRELLKDDIIAKEILEMSDFLCEIEEMQKRFFN